ncbi:MAG: hypothetical protein GWN00_25260, partial [Aliifodinibius sp.]|nr:hypothetical protein [Fodinibius sp.]NIY27991.1 hypothetical protein [Fodinibius sp.]
LNSFGEAFRQNGFQYPVDDEAMTKNDPIELGADAYKRVWPNAIWPGAIPGDIPIAIRARSSFSYEKQAEPEMSFTPPTLQLISGGTLGEDVSFFIGAHLFEEGEIGSIDRFYLKLDNILNSVLPDKLLYIRAGQFIPEIVPFASNHRGLTITPYAFNTYDLSLGESFAAEHIHGGGPFGIENFQLGVEASGIIARRNRYVAGFVNGNGSFQDNNDAKDGYIRLVHKFGGMAFDGSWNEGAEPYGGTGNNWVEKSLALGVFGYKGASRNETSVGQEDLEFYRLGADVNVFFGDLNLYGGYMYGNNEMVTGDAQTEMDYDIFFAEGNYVLYPWLIGVLRYEEARPEGLNSIRRVVPNITALFRANIKWVVEVPFDPDEGEFERIIIGLDYGF